MWDLYWIQRLGAINTACIPVFIVSIIATVALLASYYYNITEYIKYRHSRSCSYDVYAAVEAKKCVKICSRFLRISIPAAVISLIGLVFVPTTKEAYMVWGVGGTIDYLKSNETAKKLPDKAVKALDKWADSFLESKEETDGKQ